MNEEILSEIRNKLTAPTVALEKLANGGKVPKEFLELALREVEIATNFDGGQGQDWAGSAFLG